MSIRNDMILPDQRDVHQYCFKSTAAVLTYGRARQAPRDDTYHGDDCVGVHPEIRRHDIHADALDRGAARDAQRCKRLGWPESDQRSAAGLAGLAG
jgi:hypothetical protein